MAFVGNSISSFGFQTDPALSELLILNKQYQVNSFVPHHTANTGGQENQTIPTDAANKDPDILQEALERSGLPVTADTQTVRDLLRPFSRTFRLAL